MNYDEEWNIYIELPINVTVEGIVIDFRPVLANMARPSIVKPFTRVTEVTEDDLNALSPMNIIIMIMIMTMIMNLNDKLITIHQTLRKT